MLEFLTSAMAGKLPEWISAIGAFISMAGVWFVWQQVKLTRVIAQDNFEDGLAREYRELASRIPTKALLGSGLSPKEFERTFDELFRYIDLSNEQVNLRMRGRISSETWVSWSEGMKFNLGLPAFKRAWNEVEALTPSQYAELRRALGEQFAIDPKSW